MSIKIGLQLLKNTFVNFVIDLINMILDITNM